MGKKILVTLSDAQYQILSESRELGETDSEKLRNAFIIYNSTKDILEVIKKMRD